ncbi:TetR/AcrR family transcriptional regulator [Kineococcus indalonis]|uniref:TetR/AcrR family transcriptional regulator n=1 Tax=Kineococcus indalonis TaxID=2696566 RepID=UPI00196A56FF|nr:TetR/AcrR family transcriptional regulator [Kineococcus indalonis]
MSGNRVGRPRARGAQDTSRTPRQEVLDAAAALFSESGYAGTSTRAIAERVGVRQASLYHHFAGKDEILLELLEASVRPTLDLAGAVRAAAGDPAAALHALVVVDVGTLLAGPAGVGALYLAPEVRRHPVFAPFREQREQLRGVYAELAAAAAPGGHPVPAEVLGAACLHLVEMVTALPRRAGLAEQVARACLGAAGVTGAAADAAARRGRRALATLAAGPGAPLSAPA